MGTSDLLNLASMMFLRNTFFVPFLSRTLSSLGRTKAEVWTPALQSPAAKTSKTTCRGDSRPVTFWPLYLGAPGRFFCMSSRKYGSSSSVSACAASTSAFFGAG